MSNSPKKRSSTKIEAAMSALPTKGTKIARAARTACNSLTDEQRDALTTEAMRIIYGSQPRKIPARRA